MTVPETLGVLDDALCALQALCLTAPESHPVGAQLLRNEMARRIAPIEDHLERDLAASSSQALREHVPQLLALNPPALRAALGLTRSRLHGPTPQGPCLLPRFDDALRQAHIAPFTAVQAQAKEAEAWLSCHNFERAAEHYLQVFAGKPYLKKDRSAPAPAARKAFFAEHWPKAFVSLAEATPENSALAPSAIQAGLHVMASHRPRPSNEVLASALSLIETLLQGDEPDHTVTWPPLCAALALWQRFGTLAATQAEGPLDADMQARAKKVYALLLPLHQSLSLPRQRGHALGAFGFDGQRSTLTTIACDPRYPLEDFKPLPAHIERLFDDLVSAAHGASIFSRNWVLTGDPGEGKTSLIKSLLAEADRRAQGRGELPPPWPLRVLHASHQDFLSQYHNESREKVHRFFSNVMQEAQRSRVTPIVVIEEADAILGASTASGINQEDNRATLAALEFLDNSHANNRLVVLCTTNRIEMFTPAARSRFGANVLHYHGSVSTKHKLVARLISRAALLPTEAPVALESYHPHLPYLQRMLTAAAVPYAVRAVEAAVAAAGSSSAPVTLFENFLASLESQPVLPAFGALAGRPALRVLRAMDEIGLEFSFTRAYRDALALWVQARSEPDQTFLPLANTRVGAYRFVAGFTARGLSQWVLVADADTPPSFVRGELSLGESSALRQHNGFDDTVDGPKRHVWQKRFFERPSDHPMVSLVVDLTKHPTLVGDPSATLTWRCTVPSVTEESSGWAPWPHLGNGPTGDTSEALAMPQTTSQSRRTPSPQPRRRSRIRFSKLGDMKTRAPAVSTFRNDKKLHGRTQPSMQRLSKKSTAQTGLSHRTSASDYGVMIEPNFHALAMWGQRKMAAVGAMIAAWPVTQYLRAAALGAWAVLLQVNIAISVGAYRARQSLSTYGIAMMGLFAMGGFGNLRLSRRPRG